ncbi:type II toxin-antitoxin system RelE/ParE family toxin [Rhizobium sp.]|uniref:type II toxin-antitoxin system RelE/ParE family toxin n=1 Tax=Rhizobium sp. TaxID=391 RepID=UPI002EF1B6C9
MAKYILSPKAEEDLRQIWRTIAPDNERAADALLTRILDKAELAAGQPLMGSPRPELSPLRGFSLRVVMSLSTSRCLTASLSLRSSMGRVMLRTG